MSTVILNAAEYSQCPPLLKRQKEKCILMAHPKYFDVQYVINPHMKEHIGNIDKIKALKQWEILKSQYEQIGIFVHVINPVPELYDMVFAANQSLPYRTLNGEQVVVMSKMHSPYRQPEVEYFAEWYDNHGYRVIRQNDPPVDFEGTGDVIWHPQKRLMYIGYGFRTDKAALVRAAQLIQAPVIALELIDPRFYHLDTALCPLDERTAIFVPDAFSTEGHALIEQSFERLIPAPISEAMNFVANGHCPNGRHFIVQKGSPVTTNAVAELGFKIIEVDTSEFIKSGGSVFCMKMVLPA